MPNMTWFQATNKCLELRGQNQIQSSIQFNTPITALNRIQQQMRAWIDIVNRELNMKRNNRDTVQEFIITTHIGNPLIPSTNIYPLDNSVNAAGLRYDSFYNITPQASGFTEGPPWVRNKEYREFRESFPDFTVIPFGPPSLYIILPQTLAQQGTPLGNDYIMFYPVPDNTYTIVYQAKQNAVQLALDTDYILWETQYDPVLIKWGVAYLDEILGEGQGQNSFALAQQALSEYYFWIAGPDEERRAVRTGMQIKGVTRGRRVNNWSDTPAQI